jgi:hypothetical protein
MVLKQFTTLGDHLKWSHKFLNCEITKSPLITHNRVLAYFIFDNTQTCPTTLENNTSG